MIEAHSLTKRYGNLTAIDQVSFRIGKGEIVGLLGPNGAGKTTTLRILTGSIPPTSGRATIDGADLAESPLAAKRKVGYLPENAPLYPEMTVQETLLFAAGIHGLSEKRTRAEQVMSETGCLEVRRRPVSNLSKGYRQRVGMAWALIHDPKVMILDEPMIGLDPRQIVEIRELIRSLKQDRAVLFSSHILQDVAALCDRILIIDRGKIVRDEALSGVSTSELEALFLNALSH